jgi:hypothetical protein
LPTTAGPTRPAGRSAGSTPGRACSGEHGIPSRRPIPRG